MKIKFRNDRKKYQLFFVHEGQQIRKLFDKKSEANDWYEDFIQKGKVLTSKITLADYINTYLELKYTNS